ncbi:MAG: SpoIIE family protein phosphatase [bacterium]|nr:SpoIIE family protein phosphatase [bacterium]
MTTQKHPSGSVPKIAVLLVDDQAMVGEAVRRMLSSFDDIELHYCQDPANAIPAAERIHPSIILQDLVMPEIDGLTLVKFFRANDKTKEIPIIVLSTKEEPAVKAEAFSLGANDYLVKLPDALELAARIRSHSKAYIHMLQRNEAYDALARELSDAASYVRSLLPEPLLDGPIRADWRFIPSTELGGDSFGYHWLDENHFAMYLLDVVGHGVGAALLSVSIMNALRSGALPDTDLRQPSDVLKKLNLTFPMDQQNGLIFTIWYGVLHRETRELRYASGGHPPALLYTDGSPVPDRLTSTGVIVGVLPRSEFGLESRVIPPSSRLLLFSDGVYEIFKPGGEMMTFNEFVTIASPSGRSAAADLDRIKQRILQERGQDELDDDYSMVEFIFT